MADDGNTGGGDTLLIIPGVGLVLGLLYVGQKKWRRRLLVRLGESVSQEQ